MSKPVSTSDAPASTGEDDLVDEEDARSTTVRASRVKEPSPPAHWFEPPASKPTLRCHWCAKYVSWDDAESKRHAAECVHRDKGSPWFHQVDNVPVTTGNKANHGVVFNMAY